VEQLHAAVVAGDQRPLGGGERHVELAPRVLAVDQQRPGDAERHLDHAGEVLDVAGQHAGVEGVVTGVAQLGPGLLLEEAPPLLRLLRCVVVYRVARDSGRGHHGVPSQAG
jgi:hypothetical protein